MYGNHKSGKMKKEDKSIDRYSKAEDFDIKQSYDKNKSLKDRRDLMNDADKNMKKRVSAESKVRKYKGFLGD